MNAVHVEIDRFSGPLALLLHLIRKEEMDIFDINIHQITEQYLASIKQMKSLNLEAAGDFVAMAATLIQIKSKMLLPQYNDEGEVIEEDPRKDLVARLLEYQMYQEAGTKLYQRPLVGRDYYLRGERLKLEAPDEEIITEENALYSLIAAYRASVKKIKKAVHKVAASLQSISDRIREIKDRMIVGQRVRLAELAETGVSGQGELSMDSKGRLLITFLSMLELAKLGFVSLFQSENFGEVHVEAQKEVSEDVLSQVESYESVTNDEAMETRISMAESDILDPSENVLAATDEEIFAEEGTLEEEMLAKEEEDSHDRKEDGPDITV